MIVEQQLWGAREEDAHTDEPSARAALRRSFSDGSPPMGYVIGKTQMRNAIAEQTGCSLAHAESLLDGLERSGKLHYSGDNFSAERLAASWQIED